MTLDEATALLLQLEATDTEELARIAEAIERLVPEHAARPIIQELLDDAVRLLREVVEGVATDPEGHLAEVGELIEAVMEATGGGAHGEAPGGGTDAPRVEGEARAEVDGGEPSLPAGVDPTLLAGFVEESREALTEAETALVALEADPDDAEACNTVFRAFHTIKGTSGFLGLDALMELAHGAESLLSRVRDHEIRFEGGFADLALRAFDWIVEYMDSVQAALDGGELSPPEGFELLVEVLEDPEAAGVSVGDSPLGSYAPAASEEQTEDGAQASISAEASARAPAQRRGEGAKTRGSWVRVRTDRLDTLIDMIGELVIAHSIVVEEVSTVYASEGDEPPSVTHAGKIVRELQDLSISMRMVPLENTFRQMARVIRDVAQSRGKRVRFEVEADGTEIDRNMVDRINDPLVHMIRNAVDHGIESPDERVEQGKPEQGTVRLSAYRAGGNVVIELRDDGRGLDRDRIVAKAVANGLIESDRGMSDTEVFGLILEPGFSTAETVTAVSGRGVGMDVVRQNLEAVHGRIEIDSEPGRGSTFSLRLPLTLAVTDGMLVRVGSERYIVPTTSIQMSFRPRPEAVSTIAGRGEVVLVRGEVVPLVRLHRLFDIEGAETDPTHALLIIVGAGDRRCALLVDELVAQQQVVAKSLGETIGDVPGVSGGAILGDGRVGLILEPARIITMTRQNGYGMGPGPGRSVA